MADIETEDECDYLRHWTQSACNSTSGTDQPWFRLALQASHQSRRYAGAIVGGKDDTAAAKMAIMRECGIHVVESPAEIGAKMVEVLGAKAKA